MKIRPLNDRVLVVRIEEKEKTTVILESVVRHRAIFLSLPNSWSKKE